ncbi:MAG: hypothetical protein RKE52_16965 [Marinovum algicola]|uniref:hypothetical protein n=1 Tax=Marinovum algicola TaxID=42444 RepID=UPI0032ED31F7
MCDTLQQRIPGQINDLSKTSTLVVAGRLEDQHDDADFIRCLNGLLAARPKHWGKAIPKSEADAVDKKGKLHRQAELVAFGDWLLVERHPGYRRKGGPEPDLRLLLKTVAAAMLELSLRPVEEKHSFASGRQENRKQVITKTDLAKRWKVLFQEERKPEHFAANLRLLKNILPAYLKHLRSGQAHFGGHVVKASPGIAEIRAGITPKRASAKPGATESSSEAAPPAPAEPKPFEVPLRYSTDEEQNKYRKGVSGPLPLPSLEYTPTPAHSTSKPEQMVFKPGLDRRDYRFRAVIDRMVLLVDTAHVTNGDSVHRALKGKIGAAPLVQDLTLKHKPGSWGVGLPELDLSKKTGQHFAILLQDPEPKLLRAVLDVLHKDLGLSAKPRMHLLEIAVDITPRTSSKPDALSLREKMVALLHRHHWVPGNDYVADETNKPRHRDARQYVSEKPQYLFQNPSKGSSVSDLQVKEPVVRRRLLRDTPGEALYLNATLNLGAKASPVMTSVQHKIADRRNPGKNTREDLAFKDRRARLEVTLSGEQSLAGRGVKTVDDLATVSFRKLTSPYLSLWLPVVPDEGDLLKDIEVQLQSRGVYGIQLRNRARYERDCETLRGSGKPLPRRTASQAMGLVRWSEMNDHIGTALDDLRKRWKTFRPS